MPATSSRNGSANNSQAFAYFGWLTLLVYLANPLGTLVDIQTSYMLKNHLHATATEVSMFRLLTAIPAYFAFVFGLMRDLWNPFGLRDRGFFLIFAPVTAAAFVWMATSPVSYRGLVIGMLLAMLSSRFIAASYQGLIALVGQEKLMSGRLSVIWNAVSYLPAIAAAFTSGYISEHLRPSETFLLVAAVTGSIGLLGLWKPRAVFSDTYEKPQASAANFVGAVKRLVKHRAIFRSRRLAEPIEPCASCRREAAHGHSELGHRSEEKGIQRLPGRAPLGAWWPASSIKSSNRPELFSVQG
jgi:hypothetical protein